MSFADSLIKSRIPRIPTIVFELVKIDAKKIAEENPENYRAKQENYISLQVLPESFNSGLRSRDNITQTNKVFVQKFTPQPEMIRLSGTFGDQESALSVAGINITLDGWGRLIQFEEMVKKSMKIDSNSIYAINYYDFLFQRFGAININSFNISANASENTNLVRYNLEFPIIGKLIDVEPGAALTSTLFAQILAANSANFTELGLVLGAADITKLIDLFDTKIADALDLMNSKMLETTGITKGLTFVKDLF
jgi:hypothetical protein